MDILDNIRTEHVNRTRWINDNLTVRERSRINRHTAIRIFFALCIYIGLMYGMEMVL